MNQRLSLLVSVISIFDHKTRLVKPLRVLFEGRAYEIIKIGYHHTYRTGRVLYHVFSVASDTLFFRLNLDTESLFWTLEEISDGESS